MGKVELNKKIKEENLLEAAFQLFTTKGIHKTSISDIVEKSGVAKGTFYLYFHDKYDIYDKLTGRKAMQLFMSVHRTMDPEIYREFPDRVIYMIDGVLDAFTKNHQLLKFISKNLSWGAYRSLKYDISNGTVDEEFMAIYKRILEETSQVYRDPEFMLYMILELTSAACYDPILTGKPVGLQELKEELHSIILGIIEHHKLPAAAEA